ncbi:MAG: hypothetical protein M1825_003215 [Sarcosagium campestre]|nr:MAG: hypothetical protein M1825_003215 [Sarcosagium campestre]
MHLPTHRLLLLLSATASYFLLTTLAQVPPECSKQVAKLLCPDAFPNVVGNSTLEKLIANEDAGSSSSSANASGPASASASASPGPAGPGIAGPSSFRSNPSSPSGPLSIAPVPLESPAPPANPPQQRFPLRPNDGSNPQVPPAAPSTPAAGIVEIPGSGQGGIPLSRPAVVSEGLRAQRPADSGAPAVPLAAGIPGPVAVAKRQDSQPLPPPPPPPPSSSSPVAAAQTATSAASDSNNESSNGTDSAVASASSDAPPAGATDCESVCYPANGTAWNAMECRQRIDQSPLPARRARSDSDDKPRGIRGGEKKVNVNKSKKLKNSLIETFHRPQPNRDKPRQHQYEQRLAFAGASAYAKRNVVHDLISTLKPQAKSKRLLLSARSQSGFRAWRCGRKSRNQSRALFR